MIDDGLKDWSGHNAAYALSVLDELCRRGIGCELFANRNIRHLQGERVNVLSTFRHFAAGMFFESRLLPKAANRAARFFCANYSHLRDLFGGVTPHVRTEDVVLVLIASSRTTLAYALWLRWLSIWRCRLTVVFIVHNRPHDLFRWETRFVEAAASGHRIVWAAHTKPVRDMCTEAAGHPSFLLPLPFGAACVAQTFPRSPGSAIVFSYLGVAGFTKGLDILVNAVEGIVDLLRDGKLRLVVQFNIHIASHPLEKLHKELALRARDIPGIEIIGRPLTPAEYQQAMNHSDVILVPHRLQSYKYALSGIFTEALSMGKPVVVASDTYMAEELQRFGAGMCFEDGNPIALAQAIRRAVEDIEGLRRRAFEGQAAWRSIHSAERYVTELYGVVNRA